MEIIPRRNIGSIIEECLMRWSQEDQQWPVGPVEAQEILQFADDDIDAARGLSYRIARTGKGNIISFSPKVFIPLTHMCRDYCGYCTFRKEPEDLDDLFMNVEQVLDLAKEGEGLGCAEALFTLGERPESRYPVAKAWLKNMGYGSTLDYLADVCQVVNDETEMLPHANPGTMSKRQLQSLRSSNVSMGLMLESISDRLFGPGMPHEFAPSKRPVARMKTLRNAGVLRIPFTTGILIGLGESKQDVVDSILAIKKLHETFGHIQEVIVQNFRAKKETPMADVSDATQEYLSWALIVTRLIMGPEINLQVPPNLSPNHFQSFLDDGINDWGGVSPLTIDHVNPEAKWPTISKLNAVCEEKGLELKPRFPVYPEFMSKAKGFIEESLYDKVVGQSDGTGYKKGGIGGYIT